MYKLLKGPQNYRTQNAPFRVYSRPLTLSETARSSLALLMLLVLRTDDKDAASSSDTLRRRTCQ